FTRAARRLRRHRTLATGAAVLAVTALVGLAVGLVVVGRQKARTEEAYRAAQRQRLWAQANFEKAREAVGQMLTRGRDARLVEVPLMDSVRVELLEEALKFYRDFLQAAEGDPDVWFETGRAHGRVADLSALLGRNREAESAYREGIALLERLTEERPGA